MTETEAKKDPELEGIENNHYVVLSHCDGEYLDKPDYVLAQTADEAECIVKEHYGKGVVEVFVTMIIQTPGPPIAIFDDEGVADTFNHLTRDGEA